jgi:hypothetical protein
MSTADPAPIEDDGIERTSVPRPPAADDGIERAPETAPAQGIERPDWLIGADEGAAAEVARHHDGTPTERPALKLHKPGAEGEEPGAASGGAPIGLPLSSRAAAEKKKKVVPWAAAASSVPSLRPDSQGPSASLGRDLSSFPDAPPLERVQTTATGKREAPPRPTARDEPPPRAREAAPPSAQPPLPRAARPVTPAPPREAPRARAFVPEPEDDEEQPDAFDIPRPAARIAPPAPKDAWWMVALDELRHNRRLQILVGALLLVTVAWMAWPRSEPGVSLRELRNHPDRYDGARVRVSGRVGQVYAVGGSYAFYLHQGRDTIVVFTRMRVPESRQRVTLLASVSTGFLDGLPRQSLFEESE